MLTASELEARRDSVGASEVAAVLGINPYRTAYEVWLDKTERLDAWEGNDQTDAGNRFEPIVLDWAEEELGPLERNVRRKIEGLPIASTNDALMRYSGVPVEAKTAGLFGPLPVGWGEAGTDEIPDYYLVQCQTQILCTGAEFAHLAAFLGGRGFTMFRVNRSEKICNFLKTFIPDWWDRHVVKNIAPPIGNTSLDVLRRLRREPNKTVEVATGPVVRYERACDESKAAEKEKKSAQAELLAAMGDAEAADFGDPERVLTFYEQTRKAHAVSESTFRVMRFSKRSPK